MTRTGIIYLFTLPNVLYKKLKHPFNHWNWNWKC